MATKTYVWILFITISCLSIIDFVTTKYIIGSNFELESNPLLVYSMEYIDSVWAILYIKIFVLSTLFICLLNKKAHTNFVRILLLAAVIIFAVICICNILLIMTT